MTRGDEAILALKEQCERDIYHIESMKGAAGCAAHPALASGIATLLRCQVARFDTDSKERGMTKRTAALVGTAAGAAVSAVISWLTGKT